MAVGLVEGRIEAEVVDAVRGEVHIADVVRELGRVDLLPAIVFRTARSQCDTDVERAITKREMLLSPTDQRELRHRVNDIATRYEMDLDLIKTHQHYNALVCTGIGAHHAGQLLMWRLLLEELMADGLLRVLVATGTVAAGVDFPARSVVITAHSKRGSDGFQELTAAEFQQMSGRAGRRGKDTVGFCVVAPSPFCDARALLKIAKRPPEPLRSSYFPGASTVLNLLRYRNVDDLRFTASRSLAAFYDKRESADLQSEADQVLVANPKLISASQHASQHAGGEGSSLSREDKKTLKRVRRLRNQAIELSDRQVTLINAALKGLSELGYVEQSSLSTKGYWAANLCTGLVIELAEIIEAKLFDDVSTEYLAAMVGSLCGDNHRRYLDAKRILLKDEDVQKLAEILDRVHAVNLPGKSEKREVLRSAAHTVVMWLSAETWQEFRGLLMLSGVAEGDAARLLTQTADHLNQLTRLYDSHPKLALRAEEAKRRILRPPLSEVINLDTV